jgi:type II secretory pathway pseudopilin PulG
MKRHYFNLIELMLALGVIVVGLVSVMALFPIGATANRDAIAENYSAMAAEQMLNSLAHYIRSSAGNWTAATTGGFPTLPAAATDAVDDIADQQPVPANDYTIAVPAALSGVAGDVYMKTANTFTEGFRIECKNADYTDFEGMMALWQEQININGSAIPYTFGTALNIEISWPAQLPYERRQKARYRLEVFNPNR